MKRSILILIFITTFFTLTDAQEVIKLEASKSSFRWAGSHSFGFGKHDGTVNLKSGELTKKNGKVTGGKIIIDMNTIVNTDGDYSQDLVDHLKSEDFFDVGKHPTAELIITKIHYYDPNNTPGDPIVYIKANANLIIKGISQPIEFSIHTDDEHAEMSARFKIDRTRWKINYQAKGFADRLKNSIISDAIEFNILLKMD